MNAYWILSAAILLIGIYAPCEGNLIQGSFQDFIDQFVDIDQFQEQGIQSINSTAMKRIWNVFKKIFSRSYSTTAEEKQRLGIFRDHLTTVIQSNLQQGLSYKLGMNNLSDWTKQEFLAFKTGYKPSTKSRRYINDNEESIQRSLTESDEDDYLTRSKRSLHRRRNKKQRSFSNRFLSKWNITNTRTAPNTAGFDWRTKNVVTNIKDQGQCGSCYSFATCAVMESAYAIKTNSQTPVSFSPQQIVDCSGSNGNDGCGGGFFEASVEYLTGQSDNIATFTSYPYTAEVGTCQTTGINKIDLGTITTGNINQGDETGLATALVQYGPIWIAMNADTNGFMFYQSGVLNIPDCANGPYDLDHAVTLVGYGTDGDLPYWIIKNSWGTSWGENGYVRLAKDADNMCGVATDASWATLN